MPTHFSRFADTTGDGTGDKDAAQDYSSAATDFKVAPAATERIRVARMLVSLSDAGGLDADAYGNNITLTNGIHVSLKDSSGILERFTDADNPVKTNAEWGHYCHDVAISSYGVGNEHLSVRWTFSKFTDLVLHGEDGEFLAITLNDNFAGLLSHQFCIQGQYVTRGTTERRW